MIRWLSIHNVYRDDNCYAKRHFYFRSRFRPHLTRLASIIFNEQFFSVYLDFRRVFFSVVIVDDDDSNAKTLQMTEWRTPFCTAWNSTTNENIQRKRIKKQLKSHSFFVRCQTRQQRQRDQTDIHNLIPSNIQYLHKTFFSCINK